MPKVIAILALCAASAMTRPPLALATEPVPGTPWRISEETDEINDEKSYYITASGSAVEISDYLSYRPMIVFKITPVGKTTSGGMTYAGKIYLVIETDGLTRGECGMCTRYDKNKATVEEWNTSTDRHAAFSPNWKSELAKLTSATNLTVRYITTLGNIRTSTFDVRGLSNALHQVNVKYLATNPPTIPDVKPKATPPPATTTPPPATTTPPPRQSRQPKPQPCRKCKGTGTIIGWKNCPRCNGAVMPGGSRCQVCIRSIHLGKVRGEIPCPVCHPNADTSTKTAGFGK